ncbi:hypothetical protein SCLCIDRAFT_116799 [Scleroderma citrinum Foug A]|uniref:CCHC-type domain-containing protein n=1 Tax=Scleroderma citrinum Foug A TaxID=1036808 RepID=A0A0C3AF50_9AGAM|nr:hypothetical protein SCLCIDRAFT_116799 [Scleroderma citrinum Foug A]
MPGTSSSNLSTSPQSTIASFTTCISSFPLSLPNPTTSHRPLHRIPTVTDFGLVVSREPALAPPRTKPFIWRTYNSSSSSSHRGKSTCRTISWPVAARKKVVADPGTYDGSPAKFHEWWSKIKIWMQVSMQGATDAEVAAAVYSQLTGLKAGCWAQVRLDHCMAAAHARTWPMWGDLTAEIEGFFLPRNNREWACAQLLRLRQGPRQRINEFLAQFEALKVQSGCPDEYTQDLLERAVSRKILEQVYLQAVARDTYLNLCDSVCDMGRAQELFIINSQGSPQYFQGPYTSSSSSASGSGTPMDIGTANTCPQPHGKGLQCYNCQGFGHIAHECTQPCRPQQQQQTRSTQHQGGNSDDERINAVRRMSFAEMRDFFKNLKG